MRNIFIINIIITYILIINIKCNNDNYNKIIYFELDNKEDLIIKNIFLNQYNTNFNFLIDTMGFITGLILSKKLSYDFILGNTFSPINSYRTFEGHKAELKLPFSNNDNTIINTNTNNTISKKDIYFPISIFKVYNKINFYDKKIKYNGVMGLALNYTEEVLLDEQYFFGESKKYSILNYFKYNLKLINKNIFSIYKDKFILGEINNNNTKINIDNININYCKCIDKIFDSYIYFFWNCDIKTILLNNKINTNYNNIHISLLFDSLLKDNILSINEKIGNIILNQINDIFNNVTVCYMNIDKDKKIFCLYEYYDKIYDLNLKIILNDITWIELPFNLLIKNFDKKYFLLNIEINEFNIDKSQHIIKIGKKIFDYYYIVFDQDKKRIGLQKLENIKINLDNKYSYKNIFIQKNLYNIFLIKLLCTIILSICSIGIIFLFIAMTN